VVVVAGRGFSLPSTSDFNPLSLYSSSFSLLPPVTTGVAYLDEYFRSEEVPVRLAVVPCDIAGSMSNQFVETSVGYDTACRVRRVVMVVVVE